MMCHLVLPCSNSFEVVLITSGFTTIEIIILKFQHGIFITPDRVLALFRILRVVCTFICYLDDTISQHPVFLPAPMIWILWFVRTVIKPGIWKTLAGRKWNIWANSWDLVESVAPRTTTVAGLNFLCFIECFHHSIMCVCVCVGGECIEYCEALHWAVRIVLLL